MSTALQVGIEKQRAEYTNLARPLLAQLAELHKLSIREFAQIFEISKSYAEEVLNHKKFPNLELALRMARYWECTVEELFGWRLDDDGIRRPLLVEMPNTGQVIRLSSKEREHDALPLVVAVAEEVRNIARKKEEKYGSHRDRSGTERGDSSS